MAVYPVASGVTSMSGTYIPEIWSGKMLVKFYTATVFGEITNTDYEGEIKDHGDTVHIRIKPDITITDYKIGQKLTYERPVTQKIDLLIDQGKKYSFATNDVEKMQSDLNYIEEFTDDAGQQMSIAVDYDILSDVYADAESNNSGATAGKRSSAFNLGAAAAPLGLDKTNITDFLVDCGTVLDENDIPHTMRWMVLPALFCGMIKKSELKDASISGDGTSILRNGRIGGVDRFMIYSSNQVYSETDGTTGDLCFNPIFGHKSAITFASQLIKHETLKNPDDFGDLVRGLQVYGYKVIKAQSLGAAYVTKG